MEYIRCEDCQCWDAESYMKLFAGTPLADGKTGYCKRFRQRF